MSLQVDIRVPLGGSLPELADLAGKCEDAGFTGVGVPDHHHTGRDAYLALAAMAGRTSSVRLYPATSNAVTRHPLVLASLVNSLDELAPGRALLSVAPGFLSVEKAGQPRATRERLRSVVPALRGLLGEGSARLDGQELELTHRPAAGAQVLLLASGPRLLELAGEVADGVMMLVGLHPDAVAAAREHVRKGAKRAGRDPADLTEILIVPIAVGPDDEALRWPRTWFRDGQPWLHYPSASTARWLRAAGIDLPEDLRPEDISADLAARICDAYGLFGSPEHCADRLLRAQAEIGLSHAFLFPSHARSGSYDLPHHEVEAYGRTIGPRVQEAQ
ncbi:MAG: LLM class flavin-dependent oxidoreductase [Streptosporangiales bacterium]